MKILRTGEEPFFGIGIGVPRLAVLALVLASLLAWGNSFYAPFVFDDIPTIVENPTIRTLWPPTLTLPPYMKGTTVDGRPVTNYSFALSYALSGDSVTAFHGMNFIIHTLAAIFLFGILRRTFTGPRVPEKVNNGATGLAFSAALLWLAHPLQTESVTYIVQRAESLSSLFYLATLYFAIRHMEQGATKWAALSTLACLFGVGSKEIVATAPLTVLLYDRCFSSGSLTAALKAHKRFYLALFSTWIALAALMAATGSRNSTIGFGFGITALDYFLTQLWVIPNYLKLAFWPHPLILDRGWDVVTEHWKIITGGIVTLSLAVTTLYCLLKNLPAGFAGAFIFIALAPTSSFIPVNQTMSEHRMYLALAGVIVIVVVGAAYLLDVLGLKDVRRKRMVSGMLVGVTAGALILATAGRNTDYRSGVSIWEDNVRKAPDSPRAITNLAHEYLEVTNDPGKAIPLLNKLLAKWPEDAKGSLIMGNALASTGQYENSLEWYEKAIRIDPKYYKAYNNLGSAQLTLGMPEKSVQNLEKSIALNPDFAQSQLNLGMAFLALEKPGSAVPPLEKALKLNPGWLKARYQLGLAYLGAGRAERAAEELSEVARMLPNSKEAAEAYRKALSASRGEKR